MNKYHTEPGHPHEETTRDTAELFRIRLLGSFKQYKDCDLAKAKQKTPEKCSV